MDPARAARAVRAARFARGALAAGATAFVIAVLVASHAPGPRAWALHLPGFLPGPARALVLALLAGSAAWLGFDFLRRAPTPAHRSEKSIPRRSSRLPRWSGWLLLLPWAALLWMLEARTHFLGDGIVWLLNLQTGNPDPFSEPLAAATWAGYSRVVLALGLPIDAVTAGFLSVLCGVIAAALFWGIAGEITLAGGSRTIALAVLATMGVVQLYFGYIESYPTVSVAILVYLWLGLRRARGADHPIWIAIALAVVVPFHLSCVFLGPSFLYLVLREKRPWIHRAALTLGPPTGATALLLLLRYPPSRWLGAFRIATRAAGSGHEPALYAKPYGAISPGHAWDVLNAILLALPIPALLLLAAAAAGATTAGHAARGGAGTGAGAGGTQRGTGPLRDPAAIFLALAAMPGLLLAVAFVLPVAPAQDWDLTSILLLPLAVFGVKAGFSIPKVPIRGARGAAIATLGAGALLSFVLVNADEGAGYRRFETLVGPDAKITAYGRAYGNELLETYDVGRKDFAHAVIHAQRALDAEPTNPRYWIKKGAALYQLGRYDEAIPALQEGIRRGPARDDAYYNLGNCLVRKKRYPEAVVDFREAVRLGEPRPDYLNNLAVALFHSGEPDSARALWTEVVQRWPQYTLSRRLLSQHFGPGARDSAGVTATPR